MKYAAIYKHTVYTKRTIHTVDICQIVAGQFHIHIRRVGGRLTCPANPFLSPPLPSPLVPFSFSTPSLPLQVGPKTDSLWSAVSSPSGVWGGAPAEIEFGAF